MLTRTQPVDGGPRPAMTSSAPETSLQGFGVVAAGLAGTYQEEATGRERFRGRFQLVDATTGEPIRSQAVRVRSTGGQYHTGATDSNGYTAWVERDVNEALAFDLDGNA
jgi:hypothetical protein